MRYRVDMHARTAVALALAIVALAAAGGVAAFGIGSATVTAPAVRGDSIRIGDPPKPTGTPYGVPVADPARAGWGTTHTGYPATDIFLRCGATLVSPVWGTVLEVRRTDAYDPIVDNPATRGGRSVAIVGYDGVRYYLAHLDTIAADLGPGDEVALGQVVGTMGATGRTGGVCHLHFGISPPCSQQEWSVRRGVVWPYPYLDAWLRGEQRSPAPEVQRWLAGHPSACADAAADPFAPDAR
jgi:murein DD-endopeptidase MepM/ murein hydrolase activator NlpD